jgi:hypothetical protein
VIPSFWQFALLALAAFRAWKLVGDDAVLDRPRDWVLDRLETEDEFGNRGEAWTYFITCPWCAGFWITGLWWLAWLAWPHGVLIVATPFALSAAVGYLGVGIDRLED